MDPTTLKLMMGSGGGAGAVSSALYTEDVFSSTLYAGTGSSLSINNGINLSANNGLVWFRRLASIAPALIDTKRGLAGPGTRLLPTSNSGESDNYPNGGNPIISSFNSSGFTLGTDPNFNSSLQLCNSWTFRACPKFFDVVTYVGDGVSGRQIPHNLGSTPGFLIVKAYATPTGTNWPVYHPAIGATNIAFLNGTAARTSSNASFYWNNTAPTDSVFTVGNILPVNYPGLLYVAYLFASDAGGFGPTGTDSIIKCGSYTGTGAVGNTINVGWEPQFLLIKRITNGTGNWQLLDSASGLSDTTGTTYNYFVNANSTGGVNSVSATSTGFRIGVTSTDFNTSGSTYIYIAIRRGPSRPPTVNTSLFKPETFNDPSAENFQFTPNFIPDIAFMARRDTAEGFFWGTRLTGSDNFFSYAADVQGTFGGSFQFVTSISRFFQNLYQGPADAVMYMVKRAAPFSDLSIYRGTGSAQTLSHNLTVTPELIIIKARTTATDWVVYSSALGATKYLVLNSTAGETTSSAFWNDTAPTSSSFTVGTDAAVNGSSVGHMCMMFATLAGLSKVGSYTGTGTTLQIDCGFTSGARLVIIKRTDTTGAWYIWDTARGISSGNDPYLLLNAAAAEVSNTDYIDPYSPGFEISSTAPAAINANGGSFIFFAIA